MFSTLNSNSQVFQVDRGVLPKNWVGVYGLLSKTLSLFMTKFSEKPCFEFRANLNSTKVNACESSLLASPFGQDLREFYHVKN